MPTPTSNDTPEAAKKTPLTLAELRTNPPANMSAEEAAAYIGISGRFLHSETHRPGSSLRPAKIGRRLIYQKAKLDRWLELKALAA